MKWLRLPGRVPLRLRVFFRGAFALLALATLALAVSVLQDEKQRSHRNYAEGLPHKTLLQVFDLLGNDHPLVTTYRRRLFAALY